MADYETCEALIKRYFFQIYLGCGRPDCANESCFSCSSGPRLDATSSALLAVQLATKETHTLCPGVLNDIPQGMQLSRWKILVQKAGGGDLAAQEEMIETFQNPKILSWSFLIVRRGGVGFLLLPFVKWIIHRDERPALATNRRSRINFNDVAAAYEMLNPYPQLAAKILEAVEKMLRGGEEDGNLWTLSSPSQRYEIHRVFLILLLHPKINEPETFKTFMIRLANAMAHLPPSEKLRLAFWMQDLPVSMFACVVSSVQHFLTIYLYYYRLIDQNVIAATAVLDLLYRANEDDIVEHTLFYNDAINEFIDNPYAEYSRWQDSRQAEFSFCSFPFVLEPALKQQILRIDAQLQMRGEMDRHSRLARNRPYMPAAEQPFLVLRVRREHLIADTMAQIATRTDLKKPLKVIFIGEEGIDEGGVQKEFFQLIVRRIFDAKFGMFTIDEDNHTVWFNPTSLENDREYHLIGMVLGLAIYNSVILDVHFPLVVYKKLTRSRLTFNDLKKSFPDLGKGLQALLDFDGDVENTFCRTFQVEVEKFGEIQTIDLKEGGGDIPVTAENRQEYVNLYQEWLLNTSISRQFAAFFEGFHAVCGGPALKMFRAEELELLICGNPTLDFHDLESVALCEDGYDKDSRVIRDFWSVVHSLTMEQKKKLLFFVTGSDRAPINGLGSMNFVISRNGPDSERLPTAHTCFNHLLLPEYDSKDKLRERLITAIHNEEGFGLM